MSAPVLLSGQNHAHQGPRAAELGDLGHKKNAAAASSTPAPRVQGSRSSQRRYRSRYRAASDHYTPDHHRCTDGRHPWYKKSLMELSPKLAGSSLAKMSGRWTQYGVQGLEAVGVDVKEICRKVGLSYEAASDPAAWIDFGKFVLLWSHAVRATGDPNLGLHAAQRFEPVARDLLSHLLMSCNTLGEGMARATGFFDLAGDTVGARLISRPTEKVFRLAQREPDHSAWAEFRLAAYWRFAETAAQRKLALAEVRFRHPDRGASRDLYDQVYGCPVKFSAIENSLVIPEELLSIPLPHASEETARAIEKAAAHAGLRTKSPRLESRVRLLVRSNMPHGDHSESAIARALHMSERTLKRRLADDDCSFTELVDDIRQRLALDLVMTTSAPLKDIARQVGYSSPGSLVRAVKRWTGQTPAALRAAQAPQRLASSRRSN